MTTVTHTDVHAADAVTATFDDLFATIDGWRDLLEDALGGALSAAVVDPLVAGFAIPALDHEALITGAGFVATPHTLTDAAWHLDWWLGGTGAGVRRLTAIDDPSHEQFRDYTAMEWWRIPAKTGARHVTGPYVDYVCTEDYTLTVTTPVVVDGRMVGLVGADALVDRIERELLPVLRSIHDRATLVNSAGRIVTSTEVHREPGSMLRLQGLPDAMAAVREGAESAQVAGGMLRACGDTSLLLITGA